MRGIIYFGICNPFFWIAYPLFWKKRAEAVLSLLFIRFKWVILLMKEILLNNGKGKTQL